MPTAAQVLLLLTIHSAVLTGCALLVARSLASPSLRSVLLKIAALSAVGTVSAQLVFGLGIRFDARSPAAQSRGIDVPTVSSGFETAALAEAAAFDEIQRHSRGGAAVGDPLPIGSWIFWGWCATAASLLAVQSRSRRRFLEALERTPLDDDLARVAARLPATVSLTSSVTLDGPVVLSPREICLPAETWWQLDVRERAAALAHELAHIERRDPLFRRVASILGALLFHQPFLQVARRVESAAAELDCDAMAAERTGDSIAMAGVLAHAAAMVRLRPVPCALPALTSKESDLVTRVRALTSGPSPRSTRSQRRAVAGASLAALVAFACGSPRWVDGQEPATEPAVTLRVAANGDTELYGPGSSEVSATLSLDSEQGRRALTASLAKLKADPALSLHRSEVGSAMGETLRVLDAVDTPIVIELAGNAPWRYVQFAMESAASVEAQFWNVVVRKAGAGQEYHLPMPVDIGVTESLGDVRALTVRVDSASGATGVQYSTQLVSSGSWGPMVEIEEGAAELPTVRGGPFESIEDLVPLLEDAASGAGALFLSIDARAGTTLLDVCALLDAVEALPIQPRQLSVLGSYER